MRHPAQRRSPLPRTHHHHTHTHTHTHMHAHVSHTRAHTQPFAFTRSQRSHTVWARDAWSDKVRLPNWADHFAPFSDKVKAELLPLAQDYDGCLLEHANNPRCFQKPEYHATSAPPIITSPWTVRSPFDDKLKHLGWGWYVPRCQTARAYGR